MDTYHAANWSDLSYSSSEEEENRYKLLTKKSGRVTVLKICDLEIVIQFDRAWRILKRIMDRCCTSQVWKALRDLPRDTHSCHHCQRCFDKVLTQGCEYLRKIDISVFVHVLCNVLMYYAQCESFALTCLQPFLASSQNQGFLSCFTPSSSQRKNERFSIT